MRPPHKRKRSENWEPADKLLLHQLIQEKIHIIENKNVDTQTCIAKRSAWKEILCAFNKRSNTKRDFPQIHSQWRRIKMHMKNRKSVNIKANKSDGEVMGGGPLEESTISEHLMVFKEDEDEFILDHSIYDNNSRIQQNSSLPPHTDKHVNDHRYLDIEKPIEAKNAEAQHIKNKYDEEIETLRLERTLKLKAFEADEKRKDEEHRMKLQFMEEEHQLKIEVLTTKTS